MRPLPSPRIPPNELRPGRHWYATAVAITVALIALGAAIGVSEEACALTGPGDPALTGPGIDVFLTRGQTRNALYDIDVSPAGEYEGRLHLRRAVPVRRRGPRRRLLAERYGSGGSHPAQHAPSGGAPRLP
ncbi:hypothetical protein J7I94_21590 [Streptomyces sp. ISL-12]|uniref:hypothetical protein n=1 Tax=Streptomyces sp. ISL-12 TaxID=2819177 RepID=UPI001BE8D140|nr:hypothetical protein [Streptomyces sp. ISL-12]MBT2413122.1 hypothetical protein [Streptomyces sp. ISL-12]